MCAIMAEKKATTKASKTAKKATRAQRGRTGGTAAAKKAASPKTAPKKAAAKSASRKKTESAAKHFAVIATGGKQYVVREGDVLAVEKLGGEYTDGASIEFENVLLVDDGKNTTVGDPTVPGAKVVAEFIEHGRGKKIEVIRFRAKSRYFKNRGHRQPYSRVKVTTIG